MMSCIFFFCNHKVLNSVLSQNQRALCKERAVSQLSFQAESFTENLGFRLG